MGLERLLVKDYSLSSNGFDITLSFEEVFEIGIPGVEGFYLTFNPGNLGMTDLHVYFVWQDDKYTLTIDQLTVQLTFPTHILHKPDKPKEKTGIQIKGGLTLDQDFNLQVKGWDSIEFPLSEIGDSGFLLKATGFKLDLSRKENLPEASLLGNSLPGDFVGVFFENATITFPKSWAIKNSAPTKIIVDNAFIGSHGITASVQVQNLQNTPLKLEIGGFKLTLNSFKVHFENNVPTETDIEGTLWLPYFNKELKIRLDFDADGEFILTLSGTGSDGLVKLHLENLLNIKLRSLQLGVKGDEYFIDLSGSIEPLLGKPVIKKWPTTEIESLRVYSDGKVEVDGGWLSLPKQASLDLGGFKMELSKIGFGKEEKNNWIGFSGSIKLVNELSLSGSVEGLKIIWPENDFSKAKITLKGIGVEASYPEVFHFKGAVSLIDKPNMVGFSGAILLSIKPLNFKAYANLVIGRDTQKDFNFWYIDVGAEFTPSIPVFAGAIGIYGLRLVNAFNMKPNRKPSEHWFEDWYKRKSPPLNLRGISPDKFETHRNGFGLGAGASFATTADNGHSLNVKCLVLILFPGPILMIEGKAALLKARTRLKDTDEPPFKALLVLDGNDPSFLLNIEAEFKKKNLLEIAGGAEAYFNLARTKEWHFYLGQRTPEEKRIKALVLSFLKASAYFMLDPKEIATGAKVFFGFKFDYKIVALELAALIEGDAKLSFDPVQFDGALTLMGKIALRIFWIRLGMMLKAQLKVKAPKPFEVYAGIEFKLDLPWPLPSLEVKGELLWKGPKDPPALVDPFQQMTLNHNILSDTWEPSKLGKVISYDNEASIPSALNLSSTSMNKLKRLKSEVPLDGQPNFSFNHSLNDAHDLIQPSTLFPKEKYIPEKAVPFTFDFGLSKIELYELSAQSQLKRVSPKKLNSFWQFTEKDKNTQFRLNCRNTFSYLNKQDKETLIDEFTRILGRDFICGNFHDTKPKVVHWLNETLHKIYPEEMEHESLEFKCTGFPWVRLNNQGVLPLSQLLAFNTGETLKIILPEEVDELELLLNGPSVIQIELFYQGQLVQNHADYYQYQAFSYNGAVDEIRIKGNYVGIPNRNRGNDDILGPSEDTPDRPSISEEVFHGEPSFSITSFGEMSEIHGIHSIADSPFVVEGIVPSGPFILDLDPPDGKVDKRYQSSTPVELFQITYLTKKQKNLKNALERKRKLFRKLITEWKSSQPLFKKETAYVCRLISFVKRSGEGQDKKKYFEHRFAFKTASGPKDMAPYVKETLPKDGGGPFYCQGALRLDFQVDYLKALYGGKLTIDLYDNNDLLVAKDLEADWKNPSDRQLEKTEEVFWRLLTQSQCSGITHSHKPKAETTLCSQEQLNLKPKTLYKACVKGENQEVYTFRFTSSKFKHFEEHLESFLKEPHLWDYKILASAYNSSLSQNTSFKSLKKLFKWPYTALSKRVELTLLRNHQRKSYGLFLNSPEPLEWKLIKVFLGQTELRCFPNDDACQAFLFHVNQGRILSLGTGLQDLTFKLEHLLTFKNRPSREDVVLRIKI